MISNICRFCHRQILTNSLKHDPLVYNGPIKIRDENGNIIPLEFCECNKVNEMVNADTVLKGLKALSDDISDKTADYLQYMINHVRPDYKSSNGNYNLSIDFFIEEGELKFTFPQLTEIGK